MSTLVPRTLLIIVLLAAGLVTTARAHGLELAAVEAALGEEAVTVQDLEVAEPTLLPSSPFYFFKNLGRGIQRIFTFNPVKKAELELRFADETIAETKKLAQTSPEREDALRRAVENYRTLQERLKSRLGALGNASENPNVDRLLEKLADRAVKHEKIFGELQERFADSPALGAEIEKSKEGIEESVAAAAKKDADQFVRKLEKALVEAKGSEFKHVRSIEILERIQAKADPALGEKLSGVREDFTLRLKEDIEAFAEEHGAEAPEAIRETLERLPGEKVRRLITIEELCEITHGAVAESLAEAGEILATELKEREDVAERVLEVIRHAKERLVKLETKLRETADAPEAAIRHAKEAAIKASAAEAALGTQRPVEAFEQAHSAELLARSGLQILEEERPENEDLKEDIAELAEVLNEEDERTDGLDTALQAAAKKTLGNARFHRGLAAETLATGAVREAKRHLEEAKSFQRRLERKEEKAQLFPPASRLPRCEGLQRKLSELEQMLAAGTISKKVYLYKYEEMMTKRELNACRGQSEMPKPIAPPPSTSSGQAPQPSAVVCTQEYAPVCGEDGKTYSNACHAKVAGVTVKYRGECGRSEKQSPAEMPLKPPPAPEPKAELRIEPAPAPAAAEFKLEADDRGFYPEQSIAVAKGAKVTITFVVRTENVYYGGLDFRSSKFKTPSVKPGGSTTVEFTADEPFVITSYWPLSGVEKAKLPVEIR